MNNLTKHTLNGQRGQAFAITLIVVAITVALSVPLLGLLSSVLHRSAASRTNLLEQYSVDAGTEDAIWRIQNDPNYLMDILRTVPPPTYTIPVNGQPVEIKANPVSPPSGTPTPVPPTPTPNPGITPLMWTTVDPPEINLLNPPATVRVTINIQDSPGGSVPILQQIVEVLPAGFTFVPGTLQCDYNVTTCTNLVWHTPGDPLVQVSELEDPLALTIEDPTTRVPNPKKGGELPDPWDPAAIGNSCPSVTNRADDDAPYVTQRLDWLWDNPRPKVVSGTTTTISFDVNVPNPIDIATLPIGDNPWIESNQNQCNQGGQEQFQAGKPFVLKVYFAILITTNQGNTVLTSQVRFVQPDSVVEIKAQQYK